MITARLSASASGRCDTAEGAFNDALSNLQSQIYSVNEGLRLDNRRKHFKEFTKHDVVKFIRAALIDHDSVDKCPWTLEETQRFVEAGVPELCPL